MRNGLFDFSERWAHKAVRYWVEALTIFADLAAIGAVAYAFAAQNGANLVSLYVIGLLTALLILLIVQEYRFARKAAYSESMRYIHAGLHYLRDTAAEVAGLTNEQLERNLTQVLGNVANAFALVTRTNCRACIKVIALAPDAPIGIVSNRKELPRFLLVRTLARDPSSRVLQYDETADWLTENTDFLELFDDPSHRCFLENDLKKRISGGQYRNSHIPKNYDNKHDDWPLEYRSTVVWPIRKMVRRDGRLEPELRGFLCVDSRARNVFEARYDFHLGAAVADALYMYMAMAQRPGA